MSEKKFLSEKDILQVLKTHFGLEISELKVLSLGADMDALVFKAIANTALSYFIKIKRNNQQDISAVIVELLRNAGIKEIIPPIKTLEGRVNHQIEQCTVNVYPFIEGQDGFSRTLTNDQWITLGKTLKKIHVIKVSSDMQNHIRRESYSSKWRKQIPLIYKEIDNKPKGDEFSLKFQEIMNEKRTEIYQLVNNAGVLSQKLQNEKHQFVLCHSDIHGGNVLLSDRGDLYIVDWDEPIMAPKERDLMFVGAGVANVWNKPEEEILFYKGYREVEINKEIIAYYRNERIIEDIAEYAEALLLYASSENDRAILLSHFTAMFVPQGVVDIALKTAKHIL
jgi:spectinomycin phosphotransferase